MIILNSVMEGIMGFLMVLIIPGLIYLVFFWIAEKFWGIKVVSKFEVGKALSENHSLKTTLANYSYCNPEIVSDAIDCCKNKGYKLTVDNILSEIYKLNRKSKQTNLKEKLNSLLKNLSKNKENNKATTKIQLIQKLNELYKENAITESEFNKLKDEIL